MSLSTEDFKNVAIDIRGADIKTAKQIKAQLIELFGYEQTDWVSPYAAFFYIKPDGVAYSVDLPITYRYHKLNGIDKIIPFTSVMKVLGAKA